MNAIEQHFLIQLDELIPGFCLSDHQMMQLHLFYKNLSKWNEVMNLTAITEEVDVYTKHFLDSYSILTVVPRETFTDSASLIDIGSGAGFPGLPLAIAFPALNVTLMDSLNKRINFLNDTIQLLELQNVFCIHSRAEELGRNADYREKYDFAVSRAVANLSTLNEYCIPFLKIGGSFIAYKGEKASEEIYDGNKAAKVLGGNFTKEFSFFLPETDYRRTIITYRKVKTTPARYPRKAGIPSRNPLCAG